MNLINFFYFLTVFFYLIPILKLFGINTYTFGNTLVIILTIILLAINLKEKKILKLDQRLFFFIIIFVFSKTTSVINARDISAFLSAYKDFLISIFFFYTSLTILKRTKKHFNLIRLTLFSSTLVNLVIQLSTLIGSQEVNKIIESFLDPNLYNIMLMNINRGRIYLQSYDEIVIPLIFLDLSTQKKILNKISGVFFSIIIGIVSLLTSFRTKAIMFFASLIIASINTEKKILIKSVLLILIVVCISYLSLISFTQTNGKTVFDRFFLSNKADTETIISRLNQYNNALHVGSAYLFFGAGLGNYNLYLTREKSLFVDKSQKKIREDERVPHNIFFSVFAETGLFGIASYLLLLIYFLQKDVCLYKRREDFKLALSGAFWTLFIYALFNPTANMSFNILFWYLRAGLEA